MIPGRRPSTSTQKLSQCPPHDRVSFSATLHVHRPYPSSSTYSLTPQVLKEAIALPAAAIIAYHPPLFKPLSSLTLANPLQASLLWCVTAGISIYSPHTALDSVYGGINDWLADGLGEGKVELLHGETVPSLGGGGRLVCLDEKVSFKVLQERVKKYLGLTHREHAVPAI